MGGGGRGVRIWNLHLLDSIAWVAVPGKGTGIKFRDEGTKGWKDGDVLWRRKMGLLDFVDMRLRSWIGVQFGVGIGSADGVGPMTQEPLFARLTMCRASS